MTLTLGMILTADASGAKAALAGTAVEVKKVTAATTELGAKARETTTAERGLGAAATEAAGDVRALAAAKANAAVQGVKLAQSSTLAAGSLGNLVANFNDVGMMMMAGQNPLTLAIQQGTQISQVIGPMGAAGAVKALGAAFVGMLNPVNLITIAGIAAGAAMIQWMTGASEKAASFEDQIGDLTSAVQSFRNASSDAGLSAAAMFEKFGTASPQMQQALQALAGIQKLRVNEKLREIATSLAAVGDVGLFENAFEKLPTLLGLMDEYASGQEDVVRNADQSTIAFAASLQQLKAAIDPAERYRAALDLSDQFLAITGGIGNMTAEQLTFYQGLQNIIVQTELLGVNVAVVGEKFETTTSAADLLNSIVLSIAENLGIAGSMDLSGIFARAQGSANVLLTTVNGIIGQMARMATQRAFAANATAAFMGPDERGSQRDARQSAGQFNTDQRLEALGIGPGGVRRASTAGSGGGSGGGGGGGGAAVRNEADAVAELIAKQERELEILRETDPVQKELLRLREQLKGATDAERKKVEELITARLHETDVAKGLSETWDFMGNAAYDALDGILLKGKDAGEVLDNLVASLAQAALQALILGEGPLAKLFGTSGTSVIDLIVGAVGGKAAGGGGPAAAAQKVLGGAGALPKAMAAQSRAIQSSGGGGGGEGGGGGPRELRVVIDGARGNREIEDAVMSGVRAGIKTYDREALPARVRQVSTGTRRIG